MSVDGEIDVDGNLNSKMNYPMMYFSVALAHAGFL
jgi:hypothetical protein